MTFDIGGGSTASFSFDAPGASVTGKVVGVEEVQQTDMATGEPAFWPSGNPKMMYRVTLQTQLRDDPDDDGLRTVHLRGSRKPESKSSLAAVVGAVQAATGGTDLEGCTITLTYVGDGQASQRGFNPPKLYEATCTRSMSIGAPVPAAAPQPAPVAQAAPAPQATPEQAAAVANLTPAQLAALIAQIQG